MKITVRVTKEILHKSAMCGYEPGEHVVYNCAIALAVREIFPYSRACYGTIVVYDNIGPINQWHLILNDSANDHKTPVGGYFIKHKADDFIKSFDRATREERINMEEFSFEIDVLSEVIDQIGISQVYKILSESRTLELAVKYEMI